MIDSLTPAACRTAAGVLALQRGDEVGRERLKQDLAELLADVRSMEQIADAAAAVLGHDPSGIAHGRLGETFSIGPSADS